jgi:hypothetical protein
VAPEWQGECLSSAVNNFFKFKSMDYKNELQELEVEARRLGGRL